MGCCEATEKERGDKESEFNMLDRLNLMKNPLNFKEPSSAKITVDKWSQTEIEEMKDPILKIQENIDTKTSVLENSSLLELNPTAKTHPKTESGLPVEEVKDLSQSNANNENKIEINTNFEVVQEIKIPEEVKFPTAPESFAKGIYGLSNKITGVFARISEECKYQAQQSMREEKWKLLQENFIMDEYAKIEVKARKKMPSAKIFQFFEEMMESKYKTDLKDLKDRRKPRSMTEFLMEFLNRKFGIEKLAMKNLGRMLPTLKILVDENHPYACFFARLLQIFHPDPIPFNLALYLVKARYEFQPYIEKADKHKEVLEGKKNPAQQSSEKKTHHDAKFEHAGTGGEAMIVDVLDHIQNLFENDPESGTIVLEKIYPEKVNFNDFIAFIITNKMKKKGKRPEEIFNKLDKDKGGSIDGEEFIRGAKNDLDLWISNENIIKFFQQVDTSGNGEIELDEFQAIINFEKYERAAKNLDYVVKKEKFLNALVDVYEFRQVRDGAYLRQTLVENNIEHLNIIDFAKAVNGIDPELQSKKVMELYNECIQLSSNPDNGIEKEIFVKIMLKYGVGQLGLGSFAIKELLGVLEERKFVVDISLKEDKASPTKSRSNAKKRSRALTRPERLEEKSSEIVKTEESK